MSGKKRGARSGSEDSGELSDTTRAVRRIQRQLQADDDEPPHKKSKGDKGSGRRGKKMDEDADKPMGDGRKFGAITGVKLDVSGPTGNKSSGLTVKGKGGSEKAMGVNLESLVSMEDGNCRSQYLPDALGSFRRRDLEAAQRERGETGSTQRGIDGKVYNFVSAPSDESASDDGAANQKSKVAQMIAKETAEKEKDKKKKGKKDKKKKQKKKDKKDKKKKKDKEKKKKTKKKKQSSTSSSSDSSSS